MLEVEHRSGQMAMKQLPVPLCKYLRGGCTINMLHLNCQWRVHIVSSCNTLFIFFVDTGIKKESFGFLHLLFHGL